MSLMYPYLLVAMGLPLLVFAFLISTNKSKISRVFDEEVLKRLSATDEGMPLVLRNILMFLALFLMIIALARPVVEKSDKTVAVEGLTMLSALDISGSMRSADVYPSRLEFAKKKMSALLDNVPSDNVGVIAFAYSPFVLAPFSTDKETLKMMVDGVNDSYINMGSTDFLALGELTASLLEEKKPKILILFTDGGDKEAIRDFSSVLKENDIDLYVVLVGTQKGAPVIDENGKPLTNKDGTVAITQRNDTLGHVAKENDGAYVIAGNGNDDIKELVSVIRGKYKNQLQAEVKIKETIEYFYYPLGVGLLLLLISFSSWTKRSEV